MWLRRSAQFKISSQVFMNPFTAVKAALDRSKGFVALANK